jgi:hypothetical protein
MQRGRIESLVRDLDTTSTREHMRAWQYLRPLGGDVVPFFLEFFPSALTLDGKISLLVYALPYARESDAAVRLGILALGDASRTVRHHACGLLAYSLSTAGVPALRTLLAHREARTRADARSALDAIAEQNHHLYIDRDRVGVWWLVRPGDAPGFGFSLASEG